MKVTETMIDWAACIVLGTTLIGSVVFFLNVASYIVSHAGA